MKKIEFSPPDITMAEVEEVKEALLSGWITTGPKTKEFERMIAMCCQTNTAVCMNSATACLEMALRILGIGAGDEVILPAYTYTATCSPVCHVGATPVMIDCAPNSYEPNYDALENAFTARTKAVIGVDIAGIVADYERITTAAENKKHLFSPANDLQAAIGRVAIIADSAHGFGAWHNGKMSGSIADFTSFSFHAVKNLTTAEGGALTWNLPNSHRGGVISCYTISYNYLHYTDKTKMHSQKHNWERGSTTL